MSVLSRTTVSSLGLALAALAASASGACTGRIDQPGGDGPGTATAAPARDPGSTFTTATAPPPNASSPPTSVPPACAPQPLRAFLRRLTNREYARTVRDLLDAAPALIGPTALPDEQTIALFDDNAEFQDGATGVDRYSAVARVLAQDAVATPARRQRVIGCDPAGADRAACMRSFVTAFAHRAYRRTLAADEVDELLALARLADGDTNRYATARVVIEAVLQSPDFLYRVEAGTPDPATPGLRRLGGTELATRLAYTLWGTMPDDALLATAEAGKLDGAAGLAQTAAAMIADPRHADRAREFLGQWLGFDRLGDLQRDAATTPGWSEALRRSMQEAGAREAAPFAAPGGPGFTDALTSTRAQVDANLAPIYGVPRPAQGWAEVTLPPERAGLLTRANVLALTAPSIVATAPVYRGKYVRERLLCQDLPPPPVVPRVPDPIAGQSERQRLERHESEPGCAACHALLDPIGLGLARFDELGRARAADGGGHPIDVRGRVTGLAAPDFDGAAELGAKLAAAPALPACAVTQYFRFAAGYQEKPEDQCTLDRLRDAFVRGGQRLADVALALVQSDAFRTRTGGQ